MRIHGKMVCHYAERVQNLPEFYEIGHIRIIQRNACTFSLLARTLLADIMSPLLPA